MPEIILPTSASNFAPFKSETSLVIDSFVPFCKENIQYEEFQTTNAKLERGKISILHLQHPTEWQDFINREI